MVCFSILLIMNCKPPAFKRDAGRENNGDVNKVTFIAKADFLEACVLKIKYLTAVLQNK